jgi:Tol biopolymer transport system component
MRKALILWLGVLCTLVLFLGMAAVVFADDEVPADTWQVRTIATPAAGTTPSFISSASGKLVWTGAKASNRADTYIFDLVSGVNKAITPPPGALPGKYFNPSADGVWVAFQGARSGAAADDIFVYNTDNGITQQVTHNTDAGDYKDWNPRLDAGRIVWEKDMTGPAAKPGIYLYNIAMATTTCIIEGDGYRDPDISGDYIVATKPAETGGGTEIILYNLVSNEIKVIADSTKSNEDPRIDSGQVVWSTHDLPSPPGQSVSHTFQIMLYDIATDTTTALTNDVAVNSKPSIKNGIVAWKTGAPSAVVARNLGTGVEQRFAQGDTVENAPEVDERGIAWCGKKGLYYALPVSEVTRFPDVDTDHPYAAAIEAIADLEIIEGYTNGCFGPSDPITRQQFAKMIVLTMAVNNPTQFTATLNDQFGFTDSASINRVQGQLYPYHYVAKAALTGLTVGYPDGSFRPLNRISRQQVITMIVRAGSQVLTPAPSTYQGDLSYANPEHGQRIRLAEHNGLLNGIVGNPATGALRGWDTTGNATRGEVAQILYNLLGRFSSQ